MQNTKIIVICHILLLIQGNKYLVDLLGKAILKAFLNILRLAGVVFGQSLLQYKIWQLTGVNSLLITHHC